ncbi:MAG: nucleotidyltransferase domain-containing protein [Nanoarchaeota archaeon]
METEKKIIKYLIETKKELTIRELSKQIMSDYKITHTAVHKLAKKGLLKTERIGKSILIKLGTSFDKDIFEVEFKRREDILQNKNLKIMLDSIKNNLKNVNFILLLFGSYAKKKSNKNSDIDLMFIVPDLHIEKDLEDIISLLPLKIHYFVFNEEQFRNMKQTHELNVVKEAIQHNIILQGIEHYYELIR